MVVKVFLVINTEPGRLDEIYANLKGFDEVVFACPIENGPFDIVAMVEVESLEGYRVLIERVAAIPHTVDFSSFINSGT
ncbi:MAG: Lrp/AsnC ligand binding domain-containing protein [Candidatus Thorarchaeota archaeon]